MQVEQKRACASCGSENAPDAGFCWRCLTPFAPPPPPPGSVARSSGVPTPGWSGTTPVEPATSTRARSSKLVGVLVSIVVAAAGYVGVQYLMGPSVSLPDELAGAERLTDQESRRFEAYTADEGERYGIDAEGGVYGSPFAPEFFVILVDAKAAESTDQLFDALAAGFAQAGAVVDQANARSGRRGDSDYRCVAAAAGGETAVACMWRDERNVGIVLELSGNIRSTRKLLWTVHDTVVG
jgi:hypothetical protein